MAAAGRDTTHVVGNFYPKYQAKNPAVRFLTNRWVAELESVLVRVRGEVGEKAVRALDAGCGEGTFAKRLDKLWPSTLAFDLPDEGLRTWWASAPGPNYMHASIYSLPFPDKAFDVVTAIEVLEHLEEPSAALSEIVRVSKGHVVLSVPREPIFRGSNLIAGRYVRSLGNTPGHLQHWSKRSFVRMLRSVGTVRGVWSPFPWTIVWLTLPD